MVYTAAPPGALDLASALAGARGRNATDDSLIEWFPAVKSNATRFEKLRGGTGNGAGPSEKPLT